MAVARLRSFLDSHKRIAIDTCMFIYQWQAHPRYSPLTDVVFSSIEHGDVIAVTSTISMTELLVHPHREHDEQKVSEILGLFSTYPNLHWVAPQLEIAVRAAEIRAQHRLHTPDALQAATALHAKASALITNDPIFERVPGFETLVLNDYA